MTEQPSAKDPQHRVAIHPATVGSTMTLMQNIYQYDFVDMKRESCRIDVFVPLYECLGTPTRPTAIKTWTQHCEVRRPFQRGQSVDISQVLISCMANQPHRSAAVGVPYEGFIRRVHRGGGGSGRAAHLRRGVPQLPVCSPQLKSGLRQLLVSGVTPRRAC